MMIDRMKTMLTRLNDLHTPVDGSRSVENGVTLDPPKPVLYCRECDFVEYPCSTVLIIADCLGVDWKAQ